MDDSTGDQRRSNPAAPVSADSTPTSGESSRTPQSFAASFLECIRNSIGSTNDTNGRAMTILPVFRENSGPAPRPDAKDGADSQEEEHVSLPDESDIQDPSTPPASKLRIRAEPRPQLHLLTLPPEIHVCFLECLELVDIEQLRRTCWYFKNFATREVVRSIFGGPRLNAMRTSYCHLCYFHDPLGGSLLHAGEITAMAGSFVLCLRCAYREGHIDMRNGAWVMLSTRDQVWLCPLCGRPTISNSSSNRGGCFHSKCSREYKRGKLRFVILGFLQMSLGIVAVALAWRYFRNVLLVFAPTVASFLLLWLSFALVSCRHGCTLACNYPLAFLVELAILGLWIPPVYVITKGIAAAPGAPVPVTTIVALLFFLLNMIFRLLNTLGNAIIWSEYDLDHSYRPIHPWWRRTLLDPLVTAIVFWTFPAAIKRYYHQVRGPRRRRHRR